MHQAAAVLDSTRTCSRLSSTVSTCRKSTATIPAAWACRSCRQVGSKRRGAGSMPAARRSSRRWMARLSRRVCQFAVDPAISPQRVLLRQPTGKAGDARDDRRAAGLCAACLCRTSSRPVCGARPAPSRASRGRCRSSACGAGAVPARRTTSGRPARTAPGRHCGPAPRSRAGGRAAQHPSPGRRGNTRTAKPSTRRSSE